VIISTKAEKACDRIQHPFMLKALKNTWIEGMYLNKIVAACDKPVANTDYRGKTESISSVIRTKQVYSRSLLLFNTVLTFLARRIW
jgi:hypothetical protein